MNNNFVKDIEQILSHRYDNGADLWATNDKKLLKGAPFTTLECINYLLELGVPLEHDVFQQSADLIFSTWRMDGRFKTSPTGGIYPCHTALALKTLCSMGYVADQRISKTFQYFLDIQADDGGWKCHKYSFGRGPETEFSTPYTTLTVLDAFRYTNKYNQNVSLEKAVDFLLQHWTMKKPISPCHYGIGKLFNQIEYPMRGYNLFYYVYVLSFYDYAKNDSRFKEAFTTLQSKLVDSQIIVERVVPKLAKLSFCQKAQPSFLATKRYQEICQRIDLQS
ncbi:prenyltransferase [Candidatus Stoquefichus massiliensis]|uniref:prenyltransferase n=1 Tax=Candidatus Stoquefichus massiliensis TaxID=1470350 RepID=UPI0004846EC2|nr:prenyltransferase [Candidatus Stoquefichus massiliensis]